MITGAALAGIIVGAIALACAVAAAICVNFKRRRPSSDAEFGIGVFSVFAALLGIWSACMFIPYQGDYLKYQTVTGTVERIEAMRIEQNFAITFEGNPQPYKITDTRAALVEPGDELILECVKEFEWGSTNHGFNCKWGA